MVSVPLNKVSVFENNFSWAPTAVSKETRKDWSVESQKNLLHQTHKQQQKNNNTHLCPPTTSYFPVLKQTSHCMCWWKMDWMLVSEGGHRCQCSMYIIRLHVCANLLCMRRPGAMQHSAGQGGRRWGQHSLEPKTPSPPSVCVCVWELAGGSTHLENTTGRPLTQLPFFKPYALLHTQSLTSAQWGCITHKDYSSTCFIKYMQTHTQEYTHALWLCRFCLFGHPI